MTEPTHSRRSGLAITLCIVGLVALAAADLWSKAWAIDALSHERLGDPPPLCEADEHGRQLYQRISSNEIVVIEGYLELRYAENCGAAFGLLREAGPTIRRVVFGIAATVAGAALLIMFVRGRGGPLFAWSVPFIVSGAIGNLVDRIRFGYVVDFIRMHLPNGPAWPTFNIADAAITVGVVLLLLDGVREGRKEAKRPAPREIEKAES